MKITIRETRKLLKELKKKFPNKDCSITMNFTSWDEKEYLNVYISDSEYSCVKSFYNADEIRKEFNL